MSAPLNGSPSNAWVNAQTPEAITNQKESPTVEGHTSNGQTATVLDPHSSPIVEDTNLTWDHVMSELNEAERLVNVDTQAIFDHTIVSLSQSAETAPSEVSPEEVTHDSMQELEAQTGNKELFAQFDLGTVSEGAKPQTKALSKQAETLIPVSTNKSSLKENLIPSKRNIEKLINEYNAINPENELNPTNAIKDQTNLLGDLKAMVDLRNQQIKNGGLFRKIQHAFAKVFSRSTTANAEEMLNSITERLDISKKGPQKDFKEAVDTRYLKNIAENRHPLDSAYNKLSPEDKLRVDNRVAKIQKSQTLDVQHDREGTLGSHLCQGLKVSSDGSRALHQGQSVPENEYDGMTMDQGVYGQIDGRNFGVLIDGSGSGMYVVNDCQFFVHGIQEAISEGAFKEHMTPEQMKAAATEVFESLFLSEEAKDISKSGGPIVFATVVQGPTGQLYVQGAGVGDTGIIKLNRQNQKGEQLNTTYKDDPFDHKDNGGEISKARVAKQEQISAFSSPVSETDIVVLVSDGVMDNINLGDPLTKDEQAELKKLMEEKQFNSLKPIEITDLNALRKIETEELTPEQSAKLTRLTAKEAKAPKEADNQRIQELQQKAISIMREKAGEIIPLIAFSTRFDNPLDPATPQPWFDEIPPRNPNAEELKKFTEGSINDAATVTNDQIAMRLNNYVMFITDSQRHVVESYNDAKAALALDSNKETKAEMQVQQQALDVAKHKGKTDDCLVMVFSPTSK